MSLATTAAVVGIAGTAYGAYNQSQMAGAAGKDPFGKKNRKYYRQQLRKLEQNPDSIFKDKAFTSALDLGLTNTARMMAAQGFLGSGNEAGALMKYGTTFALDWFKNREQTLGNFAGAAMQPQYGAAVAGQQGAMSSVNDALSQLGVLIGGYTPSGTPGGGVSGTQAYGGALGTSNFGGATWNIAPSLDITPITPGS